jgi:hypothetical protein
MAFREIKEHLARYFLTVVVGSLSLILSVPFFIPFFQAIRCRRITADNTFLMSIPLLHIMHTVIMAAVAVSCARYYFPTLVLLVLGALVVLDTPWWDSGRG